MASRRTTRSRPCCACWTRRRSMPRSAGSPRGLVAALAKGGVIAIDGKSLKGAYDKGEKSSPRMMVSAYAAGLRLTLATVAAKDRNEVDAGARGAGADRPQGQDRHRAMRCTAIAGWSRPSSARAATTASRSRATRSRCCRTRAPAWRRRTGRAQRPKAGKKPPPTAKTETMAHGRIETRIGVVVEAKGLAEHHDFPGLKAFGRITATRTIDGKTSDRRARLRAVAEAFA